MCALAGVTLLIGGSYADTANNSFASVSGNGVVADGESGFCIKNVEGAVEITVNERPGWKCEKDVPYVYIHNEGDVDKIRFEGRDDEQSADVAISNVWECVHEASNIEHHVSSPGAKDKGPFHMIAAYFSPASKGAALSFERSIVLEGLVGHHTNLVIASRCPNPKCDYGRKNPIDASDIVIDPSPVVARGDMPKGGILQSDGRIVYPQGTYKICYKADFSNGCEKCWFHKEVFRTIDVYKATSIADEYVGLDRTDSGYANEYTMSGSVALKATPPHVAFNWNVGPNCEVKGSNDGESVVSIVKRIAGDVPGGKDFAYSSRYREERLSCGINIWDDHEPNCKASTTTTNNFTVVKVDVVIDGLPEMLEEKEGAFTYYVPDGDAPIWVEEWTNSLKDVSITCEPHDGEMAKQTVKLDFPAQHLYVKNEDGTYEEAKEIYTVEELNKTKFKLHGHKKSAKYKDKEIVATHKESGATDKAKFTVFGRPWLIPDYNRTNGIEDGEDGADAIKARGGKTVFRFWVNDDDDKQREGWYNYNPFDKGDIMDNGLHISEKYGNNSKDEEVNGRCDLVDFTPVLIDISDVFPANIPDNIRNAFTWKLDSDCLNIVWTGLAAANAADFHTQEVPNCGTGLKQQSYEADSVEIGYGREFDKVFDKKIREVGKLVVLVEGRCAGQLFRISGHAPGTKAWTWGAVNINISKVEDMVRWINLRYQVHGSERGKQGNYFLEPKNRPDSECEDPRHFVFVHGYNINSDEAVGWSCECFKRMWQSGYNGRFTGVDWYGSQSQIYTPIPDKNVSPKYWPNVVHAFMAAKEFRDKCDKLGGNIVLMAHSLGNVLVSAAISDTQWTGYTKYYMLNAAVAQQAFCENELYEEKMVVKDWRGVDKTCMSVHWYESCELKDPKDFRKKLNWIARFLCVSSKVSYYSHNENVVSMAGWMPVWMWQEQYKGILSGSEAGWGVNSYYTTWLHLDATDLLREMKTISETAKITNPLFSPFVTYRENMHSLEPYILDENEEYEWRAHCLAYSIPSTSISVGGGAPANQTKIKGRKYEQFEGDKWPRDDGEWNHSDFICVAYYHLSKFYDELVEGK